MTHQLPSLPYPLNALEPHISTETLKYHHGKHHQAYVDKLNDLVKDTDYDAAPLENILLDASAGPLFNNAAQVWNHTFYWHCLSPDGGGDPEPQLANSLSSAFGSVEDFKHEYTKQAASLFGSGWIWLVKNEDKSLDIVALSNAENPLTSGQTPLMVCDMWEHAYYIDYRNAKAKYLEAFWALVNWRQVANNLVRFSTDKFSS